MYELLSAKVVSLHVVQEGGVHAVLHVECKQAQEKYHPVLLPHQGLQIGDDCSMNLVVQSRRLELDQFSDLSHPRTADMEQAPLNSCFRINSSNCCMFSGAYIDPDLFQDSYANVILHKEKTETAAIE